MGDIFAPLLPLWPTCQFTNLRRTLWLLATTQFIEFDTRSAPNRPHRQVTWGFVAKSFTTNLDTCRDLFFSKDIDPASLERCARGLP